MRYTWIANFYTGGMEHIIFQRRDGKYLIINDEDKVEFIGSYDGAKRKQEKMEREDWAERVC